MDLFIDSTAKVRFVFRKKDLEMSEVATVVNDAAVPKNNKKVSKVELGNINPANLKQLQTINISTLPVRYTDKFYKDLLVNYPQELLQFAFWNGYVIHMFLDCYN